MLDGVIWPRSFARPSESASLDPYLAEPAARKLAEFFWNKGLTALKEEERCEVWYQDWLDYQAQHHLYASVLSPKEYSSLGYQFDLLKLTRFLEVFAYFSPGHGYSLQVSFLGLFSILMGSNEDLKREAIAAVEAGGLLAFGVSEKEHGSDLISNEFNITETGDRTGEFIANGRKYYIGNSNCAAIISILARKHRQADAASPTRLRRAPFAFIALRPAKSPGYRSIKKIRTFGVRSAFVGEFEVKDHPMPASDIVAEGRAAWDAVFGTVTLGKFFLGFGSIGMCEHAMEEAIAHLRSRILYRKPALEMPHIQLAMAQAYTRLAAMKLYAYRALDYVHAASEADRRYLLFCAVQKTKVSTEGVKVMAQLSECIGAKALESEMHFESALRDIQLIPGLEGSTHINLGVTAQFIKPYFESQDLAQAAESARIRASMGRKPPEIKSVSREPALSIENPYLMHAQSSSVADVSFAHFLDAFRPLKAVSNARRFAGQAKVFARIVRQKQQFSRPEAQTPDVQQADTSNQTTGANADDIRTTICLGQCMATIAYGQLIAENVVLFETPLPMISAIFHLLVSDLSAAGATLAALPDLDKHRRKLARQLIVVPKTAGSDWDYVAGRFSTLEIG